MQRRSYFRDYYDVYCILKDKRDSDIVSIIDNALKYSGHVMKSKNLIGRLCSYERFEIDKEFTTLCPKYDITAKEIASFMEKKVKSAYIQRNNNSLSIWLL